MEGEEVARGARGHEKGCTVSLQEQQRKTQRKSFLDRTVMTPRGPMVITSCLKKVCITEPQRSHASRPHSRQRRFCRTLHAEPFLSSVRMRGASSLRPRPCVAAQHGSGNYALPASTHMRLAARALLAMLPSALKHVPLSQRDAAALPRQDGPKRHLSWSDTAAATSRVFIHAFSSSPGSIIMHVLFLSHKIRSAWQTVLFSPPFAVARRLDLLFVVLGRFSGGTRCCKVRRCLSSRSMSSRR